MDAGRPFVIAGGGIAGLSTALALSRAGYRSVVLERRPEWAEIGAGIQLGPNAGKALASLGIAEDAIDALAVQPQRLEIRSGRSGQRLTSWNLGSARARFRAPYRTLHRADLLRLLLDAARSAPDIELRQGAEFTAFVDHDEAVAVTATIAGEQVEFDGAGLIGADGVGSSVRRRLAGGAEATSSGRIAWRAVVSREPPGMATDAVTIWLGRGGHIVHYPLRGGSELNIVAVTGGGKLEDRAPSERFGSWTAEACAILAMPAAWAKWPIATVDPDGEWGAGRVTLVGDAAHAVSPHLAQGAGFAIEDAVTLALAVAKRGGVGEAFASYRASRIDRTKRLHRAAETAGSIYHLHGPMAVGRDLALRLAGGWLFRRYDWIYRWQPPD